MSNLSTHLCKHFEDRPFICDFPSCRRSFKLKSHHKQHVETHKNDKKARNRSNTSLSRRTLRVCSPFKNTASYDGLAKVYKCPVLGCSKSYSGSTNLTIHIRSHTGERPFQCGICPLVAFTSKGNLDKHFSRCHSSGKHPYDNLNLNFPIPAKFLTPQKKTSFAVLEPVTKIFPPPFINNQIPMQQMVVQKN